MFRGVPLLMRVGVIMMALALALVAAAAVVSAALRSEPERLVPAEEVAAKSPDQAPRTSSGEEVSATEKSSGEKESSYYPSAEEPVGQRKKEAKEPQAVLQQQEAERPDTRSAKPRPAGQQTPSGASLGRRPNHSSTDPSNKTNPCLALNEGTGPSPPEES